MNLRHGGEIYLAYIFQYEDVNSLAKLWNRKIETAKYNKHKGQGTNIRRRSHTKEVKHGVAKSALSILKDIRMIATAMRNKITEYDVDFNDEQTKAEARKILEFLDVTNEKSILRKYDKLRKF
ncbi:MAG: hypothetical protein ACRDCW_02670 [Sarcina sp.]